MRKGIISLRKIKGMPIKTQYEMIKKSCTDYKIVKIFKSSVPNKDEFQMDMNLYRQAKKYAKKKSISTLIYINTYHNSVQYESV